MDRALDEAALIVAILIGIGILYFLGILVAIAYYFLLWMIWQRYRRAALEAFDQEMLEHTGGFRAEDSANALFGVRPQPGRAHPTAEILFGEEVRRQ